MSIAYLSICLGLFQILSSESYSFQYRSFTFLIKFIPKYFIVFDVIVNGIVLFLFWLLFLVYRSTADSVYWFCVVQFYWVHWLVLTIFLVESLGFSTYHIICKKPRILPLPFWVGCLLSPLIVWLLWLGLPVRCWIQVRVSIPDLVLIIEGKLLMFCHNVICGFAVCCAPLSHSVVSDSLWPQGL